MLGIHTSQMKLQKFTARLTSFRLHKFMQPPISLASESNSLMGKTVTQLPQILNVPPNPKRHTLTRCSQPKWILILLASWRTTITSVFQTLIRVLIAAKTPAIPAELLLISPIGLKYYSNSSMFLRPPSLSGHCCSSGAGFPSHSLRNLYGKFKRSYTGSRPDLSLRKPCAHLY